VHFFSTFFVFNSNFSAFHRAFLFHFLRFQFKLFRISSCISFPLSSFSIQTFPHFIVHFIVHRAFLFHFLRFRFKLFRIASCISFPLSSFSIQAFPHFIVHFFSTFFVFNSSFSAFHRAFLFHFLRLQFRFFRISSCISFHFLRFRFKLFRFPSCISFPLSSFSFQTCPHFIVHFFSTFFVFNSSFSVFMLSSVHVCLFWCFFVLMPFLIHLALSKSLVDAVIVLPPEITTLLC
jgi:hypothetical protein